MGRKKLEDTKSRPIRLPTRLWNLLDDIAYKEKRSLNHQVWKALEDWLTERKFLVMKDRRR